MTEDILQKGIQAFRAGQKEQAAAYFGQAVRLSPNSAVAWFWLGKVQENAERKQYCFNRALQLDPNLREKLRPAQAATPPTPTATTESAPSPRPAPPTAARLSPRAKTSPWVWVLAACAGGGLLLACLAGGLLVAVNRFRAAAPALASITPGPSPTQRVFPTAATPPSATPTLTRTPSPTPSVTPTLDPTSLFISSGFQLTAAAEMPKNSNTAEQCIQTYDDIIERMPDYAPAYYNRALCKRLGSDSNALSIHRSYINSAIDDLDIATRLDPNYGDAYAERGISLLVISITYENRATVSQLLSAALDNFYRARELVPPAQQFFSVHIPNALVTAGRCREGVDEANRLINSGTLEAAAIKELYNTLTEGYNCLGAYSDALQAADAYPDYGNTCRAKENRAIAYAGMGNTDAALQVINECIEKNPSYGGYRYYLRAYLHYAKGDIQEAYSDIYEGYGKTWYHGGLYAYLEGLFYLESGDSEKALASLRHAEASWNPFEGDWVMQRVRARLNQLGYNPQNPTPLADVLAPTPLAP